MDHRAVLDGIFSSDVLADQESCSTRRGLRLATLLAALPLALSLLQRGLAESTPPKPRLHVPTRSSGAAG
jgi:hypothetical protein